MLHAILHVKANSFIVVFLRKIIFVLMMIYFHLLQLHKITYDVEM